MGLWIRCGNKNVVFTIDWKKFAEIKKGMAGQVKCENHVDSFPFTLRVLCIMNSYVRDKQ
jgi:hypothetical protein